jgi:hypothetical protein
MARHGTAQVKCIAISEKLLITVGMDPIAPKMAGDTGLVDCFAPTAA